MLFDDADADLRDILRDPAQRVEILLVVRIVDFFQMDGVKLAFGGADAAPDAHKTVHHCCTAAEAPGALRLDLFLGKGCTQIVEACTGSLLLCRFLTRSTVIAADTDLYRGLVESAIIPVIASQSQGLTCMYIAMNGNSSLCRTNSASGG